MIAMSQIFLGRGAGGGSASWSVRYIRFHVSSLMGGNIGSLVLLQFSRIDLIDANDSVYVWPSGATVTATLSDGTVCTKGSPFTVGQYAAQESPANIIDGSVDTKVCLNCTGFLPVDFVIDIGAELVDLTIFNRWRWWTGNDNWTRGPSEFNLAVSTDGASWDIVDIPSAAVQTTSYKTIAYTGNISRR